MTSTLFYFGVYIYATVLFGEGLLVANVETDPRMIEGTGLSWADAKTILKEAEATCVGEAVEAFRLEPGWSRYQLADALRGFEGPSVKKLCGDRYTDPVWARFLGNMSVYPDSLACEVYREPKSRPKEINQKRLWRVIKRKMGNHTPEDDVVRMHVRVGDVIDESNDSVETMLAHQTYFYAGDKTPWNHYVLSLADVHKVLRQIKPQKIILVAGAHCPDCKNLIKCQNLSACPAARLCISCPLVKTCQYTHALAKYMTRLGYPAELRSGHNPDDDFMFLSRGSSFIPSGGSFSTLIANMVRRHNGTMHYP